MFYPDRLQISIFSGRATIQIHIEAIWHAIEGRERCGCRWAWTMLPRVLLCVGLALDSLTRAQY